MAAGFCSRSLLLHGPAGSGKTELVYAVAAEMGANLLYVPGGENLLRSYQQDGHRLLRALFAVSHSSIGGCHVGCRRVTTRVDGAGGSRWIVQLIWQEGRRK